MGSPSPGRRGLPRHLWWWLPPLIFALLLVGLVLLLSGDGQLGRFTYGLF